MAEQQKNSLKRNHFVEFSWLDKSKGKASKSSGNQFTTVGLSCYCNEESYHSNASKRPLHIEATFFMKKLFKTKNYLKTFFINVCFFFRLASIQMGRLLLREICKMPIFSSNGKNGPELLQSITNKWKKCPQRRLLTVSR